MVDSFKCSIKVKEKRLKQKREVLPFCIGGKRAGPPEQIGGIIGYERLIEAQKNRKGTDYEEFAKRLRVQNKENYDPEFFDRNAINPIIDGICTDDSSSDQ